MEEIQIVKMQVSPKQLSRLRNGHKVRVKPPMEGKGVDVIVDPANFSLLTRSFTRNKGAEIILSPKEILANQSAAPEMKGDGIFGRRFDRFVEKKLGKKAARELYKSADAYLPLAQAGLVGGLTTAGSALAAVQPELIPFIAPTVATLSAYGTDYLARPSKYQSNIGGPRAKLTQSIQDRIGTDDLSTKGLAQVAANKAAADLTAYGARQKPQLTDYERALMGGSGLYLGSSGRGVGSRTAGQVGIGGKLVDRVSPALASQPYAENYQFQYTLPPAYQKFSKGSGLYL